MTTDGIGVTTLVAAYGCLLRCQYCLNPHSRQQETNQCEYTPEKLLNEVKQDNLYFFGNRRRYYVWGWRTVALPGVYQDVPHTHACRMETKYRDFPYAPAEAVITAAQVADSMIIDIKDMDNRIYERYTGQNAEVMKRNLAILRNTMDMGSVRIRVPLIPKYNTEHDQKK